MRMQVVIETDYFLRDAKAAGLSENERSVIVDFMAQNPAAGAEIKGTGGARKVRFAGKGKARAVAIGLSLSTVATISRCFC
jgi:hypothetical protein